MLAKRQGFPRKLGGCAGLDPRLRSAVSAGVGDGERGLRRGLRAPGVGVRPKWVLEYSPSNKRIRYFVSITYVRTGLWTAHKFCGGGETTFRNRRCTPLFCGGLLQQGVGPDRSVGTHTGRRSADDRSRPGLTVALDPARRLRRPKLVCRILAGLAHIRVGWSGRRGKALRTALTGFRAAGRTSTLSLSVIPMRPWLGRNRVWETGRRWRSTSRMLARRPTRFPVPKRRNNCWTTSPLLNSRPWVRAKSSTVLEGQGNDS